MTDPSASPQPRRAQTTPRPSSSNTSTRNYSFGQSTILTTLGSAIPGLGLVAGGVRRSGIVVLSAFLIVAIAVIVWAVWDLPSLLQIAVRPGPLIFLAVALPLIALCWVVIIVRTHLAVRPTALSAVQRTLGAILVGVLAFAVAAPLAVAGRYSYDQYGLVSAVFKTDSKSATRPDVGGTDPFQNKPRINILLIGADDAADGEENNVRTDTMMLASIDTRTGDTVIISIPRQTMHIPFPKESPLHKYYPNGYTSSYGEGEAMANAIYYNVPQEVPADTLGKTDDLGADALKLGIGDATGLTVDYYVMVNFRGYESLVDALGGITVNINRHVPIGGNTDAGILPDGQLYPGPNQHLGGFDALWFARGRYGQDDYQRNIRQRCSVNAIIRQANPVNMMQRYEAIAGASKTMIKTDIPQDVLPAMVELSLRVKEGKVRSLAPFDGDDALSTGNPDYDELRSRVKDSIKETAEAPAPKPPTEPQPPQSPSTGDPSPGPQDEPTGSTPRSSADSSTKPEKKERSEDLGGTCEFNPTAAAESKPYQTRR